MTKFSTFVENAVDFVTGDLWKSASDWTKADSLFSCVFVRSSREKKENDWTEISRDKVIEIDLSEISAELKDELAIYGLKQITADRCFATPKTKMSVETERERVKAAGVFLAEMFEGQKIPMKKRAAMTEEQKKEQTELQNEFKAAFKAGNAAEMLTVMKKIDLLGYKL